MTCIACPSDSAAGEWKSHNGSCYKLFTQRTSWDEANKHCMSVSEGSHLLTLKDEAEAKFIIDYIDEVMQTTDNSRK